MLSDSKRAVIVSGLILVSVVPFAACSHGAKRSSAEAIERETRLALPTGSTWSAVQEYLTERRIESSFDPQSKTVSREGTRPKRQ